MDIADFDYELPSNAIAKYPLKNPLDAKLLHLIVRCKNSPQMIDCHILDLPRLLHEGDLLVFNNTKTLPALMSGMRRARPQNPSGDDVAISLNLLEPETYQPLSAIWKILAKPSKRLKIGERVFIGDDFYFDLHEKLPDGVMQVTFNIAGDALMRALQKYGNMPIPPYLKRAPEPSDRQNYQTCFAKYEGAVATPTAGLHFTSDFLQTLEARKINIAYVTLHVGAGTFLPVKVDNLDAHKIHSEWGAISAQTALMINETKKRGNKIIAVGTTTLRLLEWAGAKLQSEHLQEMQGNVDIFIRPNFRFRICDKLLTNFHQPRSTLLALVAAFSGLDNIHHAYQYALKNQYRFLSYGDACFLERADNVD